MDDFYIVLPSNSSMDIYPENTTTHFVTHLPRQIHLPGSWRVALSEIQIPLTLQHITPDDNIINFFPTEPNGVSHTCFLPCGVYTKIESLLDEINILDPINEHLEFFVGGGGGYVRVKKICNCVGVHFFLMPKKLKKILGFDMRDVESPVDVESTYSAAYPANLTNGLPSYVMVYTNILEHRVTGNVQAPLLRSLCLDLERYTYGGFLVKNFSQPMYLPVLLSSFHEIEIDIRDQFGKPIPFDYGTLTVTLHFKPTYLKCFIKIISTPKSATVTGLAAPLNAYTLGRRISAVSADFLAVYCDGRYRYSAAALKQWDAKHYVAA